MNEKEVIEALKVYIEEDESDYAAMLNGPWGCGKTYFVKNKLVDSLQKECGKACIYISLFGIKNIEELENIISLHMLNIFANKRAREKAKLSGRIINTSESSKVNFLSRLVSKGLKCIPHGSDINQFVNDVSREIIDQSKYIFIFDDFERSTISMESLLGFISELTNQNGMKLVVICNEDKIDGENKNYYDRFKEKVIGINLVLKIEIQYVFDDIVNKYVKDINCNKLVKHYEYVLLDAFAFMESSNIRTLIYILKRFEEVYLKIDKNMDKVDFFKIEYQLLYNIFQNIIYSSILMREKNSHIKIENINDDKDNHSSFFRKIFVTGKNKGQKVEEVLTYNFIEDYIEKYYFNRAKFEEMIELEIEKNLHDYIEISERASLLIEVSQDHIAKKEFNSLIDSINRNEYDINLYFGIIEEMYCAAEIYYGSEKVKEIEDIFTAKFHEKINECNLEKWIIIDKGYSTKGIEFAKMLKAEFNALSVKKTRDYLSKMVNYEICPDDSIDILYNWVKTNAFQYNKTDGFFSQMDLEALKIILGSISVSRIIKLRNTINYVYCQNNVDLKKIYFVDKEAIQKVREIIGIIIDKESQKIKKFHYNRLQTVLSNIAELLE